MIELPEGSNDCTFSDTWLMWEGMRSARGRRRVDFCFKPEPTRVLRVELAFHSMHIGVLHHSAHHPGFKARSTRMLRMPVGPEYGSEDAPGSGGTPQRPRSRCPRPSETFRPARSGCTIARQRSNPRRLYFKACSQRGRPNSVWRSQTSAENNHLVLVLRLSRTRPPGAQQARRQFRCRSPCGKHIGQRL